MSEAAEKGCNYGYDFGCFCGDHPIKKFKVFYEDYEDGNSLQEAELRLCKDHYEEFKKDDGDGWCWLAYGNSYEVLYYLEVINDE